MRRLNAALLSRRCVVAGSAAALMSMCLPQSSHAQQDKLPVVGWLSSAPSADVSLEAFRMGLRDLGYVEGRSIRVEAHRDDNPEALRALARGIVRQHVDVIVTNGRAPTRAAQEATTAIPIVTAPVEDPYEFVADLARPTGNITGLALQQTDIDAKQIEFLKEIVPELSRLAVFYRYGESYYALASAAQALGIEAFWLEIKDTQGVERAFAEAVARRANGILIVDTVALGALREKIMSMTLALRMPAAASWRERTEAGLLVTYAADVAYLQRRAAWYVDRILKGAKPDDLPFEQASKFELTVNLRTARNLGITIPRSLLVRADSVIE